MNAMLNISVNVLSRQAIAQLRALRTEMNQMQAAQAKGAAANRGFVGALGNSVGHIERFGKNLQWSGRQLEYNFTLPLVLAGGAATKWALQNEKAMTRVRKVYGDLGDDVDAELKALERSFDLLSQRFGVHLDEVTNIAAGWAQAGAAGAALARATKLTLQTMIIGEMSAVEATEKLIAVQSAYRLNTEQLHGALATLNIIENQTAINFDGLIDVITRAGGAASTAGIDLQNLAAMAAALVPQAGSAAQAGNSLRTMISRLLAPTKQAKEILNELGLEIDTATWHSKNGVERLHDLATAFDGLTQSQKAQVSATVASRWQINRFDILMRDLKLSMDEATQSQSAYWRAMEASSDPQRNAAVMARELSIALSTNERNFAILTNVIRNHMAQAIMPLLPVMVQLMKTVANLVRSFSNLSPETQRTILMFTLMLAVIGPLGRYIGSLQILIALLGHAFHGLLVAGMKVVAFLIGWPAVIAAAVAAIYIFRKQIYDGIVGAFNALPEGIQSSLMTVVRMVKNFAMTVYGWLQYLNPFARHSPSLVDNVTNGISTILDQYSRLNGVKGIIREAIAAHNSFLAATSSGRRSMQEAEYSKQRADIVAVSPGAGPAVDKLISSIWRLKTSLKSVNVELQAQVRLVSEMETSINTAMKPMNDAIFENEMAQKRLRLEILKMEQEGGGSIDDMKRKYAELNGMIEKMTEKREDLRLAGAGSEITGTFDREIDSLMEQRKAMEGQAAPIEKLQKELEDLQRTGEILTLERDIEFDPQLKKLDEEREKLREIETAYRDIESAIRDMESALNEMASDASQKLAEDARKAKEAAGSDTVEQFRDAGLGDFEVPQGDAPPGLGREGGLAEIEEFNRMMEQELNSALDAMGSFDLFAPIKDMWDKFKTWWNENIVEGISGLWEKIQGVFDNGIDTSALNGKFDGVKEAIGDVRDAFESAVDAIQTVWNALYEHIIEPVATFIIENLVQAGKTIWSELKNWGSAFDGLSEAIRHVFNIIEWIIKTKLAIIIARWELLWPIFRNVIDAVFDAIVEVIRGALEVIRGLIQFIIAVINGDWSAAWDAIVTIVDGAWDMIFGVFRGAYEVVWGIVKGLVEGIVNFFEWLADVLVGHSIIPDMVDAIIDVFKFLASTLGAIWNAIWTAVKWVWDNIAVPVWNAIKWYINNVLVPVFQFLQSVVKTVFDAIGAVIKWVWENIIKPAWAAIKWYIETALVPIFNFLRDKGKTAFEALGNGIKWVWQNIIKPIWDAIKWTIENVLAPAFHWLARKIGDAWSAISSGASSAWNGILRTIGGAVNRVIDIVNGLINGINWVTDKLGINIHISPIGHVTWGHVGGGPTQDRPMTGAFAAGTDRIPENPHKTAVGAGFKTNRVRAIVGEGNPLYPEYVIPTDPNYRGRAMGLAQMLAKDLGVDFLHPQYAKGGVPMYAFGGLLEDALDAGKWLAGTVGGGIKKAVRGAAIAGYAPFNAAAEAALNMVPLPMVREAGHALRNIVWNWVKGADQAQPEAAPDIAGQGAGTWRTMWDALSKQFPSARLHSGFRPGSITATGNLSYHARGRAIDVTPSMSIFDWIAANYGNSRELIYSPAGRRQIRNGAPHYYTGVTRSMHWDHVHWAMQNGGIIPSLANGGIVHPRPGGTLVRLGEAGRAEAVQPLPRDFSSGNTLIFNGDLSFPNITDPADAETFIANLEALV